MGGAGLRLGGGGRPPTHSASHTTPLSSARLYMPILHYFWFCFLRAESDEQGRRLGVSVTSYTAIQPVHLVRTKAVPPPMPSRARAWAGKSACLWRSAPRAVFLCPLLVFPASLPSAVPVAFAPIPFFCRLPPVKCLCSTPQWKFWKERR